MSRPALRVAVVGAGPAGIYTAEALAQQDEVPVKVDMLERLPAPFGLVRYGVAPDHVSIRSVREALEKILAHPAVTLLGNVDIGADAGDLGSGGGGEVGQDGAIAGGGGTVGIDELRRHVDAIVYTYGAARDRRLAIPGEDLLGSVPATDLVAWYCGHPDAPRTAVEEVLAGAASVVVVGVGNVAVDVARVLAKSPKELRHTDMPEHVLQALGASSVRDIHVLGRRGPAQAAFTTKELRELGELADADILVDPEDLDLDPASRAAVAGDKVAARNLDVLRSWAARPAGTRPKRICLRFWTRPVELVGPDRVREVLLERTAPDGSGGAVGTGVTSRMAAELVVRSVGYRGTPLPGLPFDPRRGIVPNLAGRVLRDGQVAVGEYVAGWIKRGPTGVIGTNKKDARETVASLLADAPQLPVADPPHDQALLDLLGARGARVLTLDDWRVIDAAEIALGATQGRARTTLHERAALLAASRPPSSPG